MFSELVVAYLFLGGTGAGALLIAAVLMLLADERAVSRGVVVRFRDNGSAAYRRLFVPILVASLVVLVLGALCLAADVGRLDRILLLAVSSPSNYLVVGFWALLLCGTLAAAMLLVWLGVPSVSLPLFRALAVLLAAVSFVAVIYTGLLLSGMPSVPLWFGPWLPGLFAISAPLVRSGACGHGGSIFGNGDGFRPNDAASRSRRYGSPCPGGGRRGAVARCSVAGTRRLGFLGGNAYRCGRVGIGGLRIERCVLSAVLGRPCARWPCCSFCDRGCPRALQCE